MAIPKQPQKSFFDCAGIPEFLSAKIGLTKGKGQFLHRLRLMEISGPGFVKNRFLKLFGYTIEEEVRKFRVSIPLWNELIAKSFLSLKMQQLYLELLQNR